MPSSVSPSRYVTIAHAASLTGYSVASIETKIARGIWLEGRQWKRAPDGRVLIDMRGYERWVEGQSAAA